MPCACNIPIADAPTNEIWGPILWKLLHGLAEYVGTSVIDMYKAEEKLAWIHLIKNTEKILPCPTCKEHYKNWLKRMNPDILKKYDDYQQRVWIRNFFWELHNEINQETKKDIVPFESLSILYKKVDIRSNMKELESLMKLIFQHNGVSILSWQNWQNYYKKLQGIYGL